MTKKKLSFRMNNITFFFILQAKDPVTAMMATANEHPPMTNHPPVATKTPPGLAPRLTTRRNIEETGLPLLRISYMSLREHLKRVTILTCIQGKNWQ